MSLGLQGTRSILTYRQRSPGSPARAAHLTEITFPFYLATKLKQSSALGLVDQFVQRQMHEFPFGLAFVNAQALLHQLIIQHDIRSRHGNHLVQALYRNEVYKAISVGVCILLGIASAPRGNRRLISSPRSQCSCQTPILRSSSHSRRRSRNTPRNGSGDPELCCRQCSDHHHKG